MKKKKKSQNLICEHGDTQTRSIVKSITYRILIVISVFVITFVTTGRWDLAAGITGITAISGTIIYYVHERVWSLIHWGKK